jgi:HD-GYP domain-containing protein (c-di-GMP phosphodiesterase class II)
MKESDCPSSAWVEIPTDQVKIGMFIRIHLQWWKHPFMRNSFKLTSPGDLTTLKGMKLPAVEYDPGRSSIAEPCRKGEKGDRPVDPGPSPNPSMGGDSSREELIARKKKKLQFLKQRRKNLVRSEQQYRLATAEVTQIIKMIHADRKEGIEAAGRLLTGVVDSLLQDEETIVHLINLEEKDQIAYFHSLNVCILSLILGKKLGLSKDEMNELAMGALLHDIGKEKIPKKVLLKRSCLTRAERQFIELHPRYGYSMLSGNEEVSPRMLEVICQHHEKCDGSGYPQGLTEPQISYFAKIASVANVYDNLSNHTLQERSLTPHEAVSLMFSQLQGELSPDILAVFIKSLGVYPPGTLVGLSDGTTGMVITTNRQESMKPTLILYDESVPREEPLIVNMEEEDLRIIRSFRPSEVSPEILAYLQPGRMTGFFVGSLAPSPRKI